MKEEDYVRGLESVLRFYAKDGNWQSPSHGFVAQYDPEPSPVKADNGRRARAVLNNRKGVGRDGVQCV